MFITKSASIQPRTDRTRLRGRGDRIALEVRKLCHSTVFDTLDFEPQHKLHSQKLLTGTMFNGSKRFI